MQKPLDQSRIIPIKTNRVIPYHYFDTSVDPKAKSRSGDRFYADMNFGAGHGGIPWKRNLCHGNFSEQVHVP